MNLNTSGWKGFRLSDIFNMKRGHTLSAEDKEEYVGLIPCINGTIEDNGVQCFVSDSIQEIGFEKIKAPALSIVRVGNGGKTFLQTEDFYVADNAFALIPRFDVSNESLLFISSLLDLEQVKYSYGRTVTSAYADTIIKLPVDSGGNPDWLFMEGYIKSLHYKPLTTKNKPRRAPNFNIQNWGEFKIGDLFDVEGSTTTSIEELEDVGEGVFPYVTTSSSNNGVSGFYAKFTEEGNIICIESACAAFATYQPDDFSASDHIEKCIPRFDINVYRAIFLTTILNLDQYKYSYGRKCNQIRIRDRIIKLPITPDGQPDWQFMEEYIKALPYGDRL